MHPKSTFRLSFRAPTTLLESCALPGMSSVRLLQIFFLKVCLSISRDVCPLRSPSWLTLVPCHCPQPCWTGVCADPARRLGTPELGRGQNCGLSGEFSNEYTIYKCGVFVWQIALTCSQMLQTIDNTHLFAYILSANVSLVSEECVDEEKTNSSTTCSEKLIHKENPHLGVILQGREFWRLAKRYDITIYIRILVNAFAVSSPRCFQGFSKSMSNRSGRLSESFALPVMGPNPHTYQDRQKAQRHRDSDTDTVKHTHARKCEYICTLFYIIEPALLSPFPFLPLRLDFFL